VRGADGAGDATAEEDVVGEVLGVASLAGCVVLVLGAGLVGVVADGEGVNVTGAVVCAGTGVLAVVCAGLTHR
jgi:hypothetical protein